MSWRDLLRPASFRGVPFKVLGTTTEIGRRNIVHQYPFKDTAYVEDLGLDSNIHTIAGHVIQTVANSHNYLPEKQALIAALQQPGGGTLIHPSLGEITANVSGKVRVSESFDREGGICRFTMTFVEAGEQPESTEDWESAVDDAADNIFDWLADMYSTYFNYGINFIMDSAFFDAYQSFMMMKSLIGGINGTASHFMTEAFEIIDGAVADMAEGIYTAGGATTIFKTAFDAWDKVIDGADGSPGSAKSIVESALGMVQFGAPTPSWSYTDTPSYVGGLPEIPDSTAYSRTVQKKNRNVMIDYVRGAAIAKASQAAVKVGGYDSADQAIEVGKLITTTLNYQLLKAAGSDPDDPGYILSANMPEFFDDKLYLALEAMRPIVTVAMRKMGATLSPVLTTYTVPAGGPHPLMVIAYDRYEDVNRVDSILQRNRPLVKHPGFPPGGAELEILIS